MLHTGPAGRNHRTQVGCAVCAGTLIGTIHLSSLAFPVAILWNNQMLQHRWLLSVIHRTGLQVVLEFFVLF